MIELINLPMAVPASEGARPAVKRVLVGDGCRVVMFTFAAGQQLREHSAAFPILVQPLTGTIDFDCDGRTARLEAGSLVHVPARVRHAVTATSDATMMLVMLDPGARLGADAESIVVPEPDAEA